ncbi:CPBP family intramembrane glutamic endopeptidase [Xylanimonas sp. McL0601]|uniref:CPBP family intramembrane glutamic endopeptidase n=1 Tax=Xylanimonas sp. McL0601 TaxID=3414739 RepID=UPI003CF85C0B
MISTTQNLPVRESSSRLARIGRSPLAWLAVGLLGVGGPSALAAAGPVPALVGAGLALLAYWAVMRFVARRPTPEIAVRGAGRDLRLGAGIGAAFLLVSVAVIAIAGGYRFTLHGAVGAGALPGLVAVAVAGALTEELLFRGLVLQAVEQLRGPRTALVVSALLFGLIHLANPGATPWSSVAIAIEAGGLMGAAFLWRRSIWLVTALHATWNGLEQLIGIPVSGHVDPSVLVTITHGPALLTGGGFGLEASIVPVVVSLVLIVALLRRARSSASA